MVIISKDLIIDKEYDNTIKKELFIMTKVRNIFMSGGILTIILGFLSFINPGGNTIPPFLFSVSIAIGTVLIGIPYLLEDLRNR